MLEEDLAIETLKSLVTPSRSAEMTGMYCERLLEDFYKRDPKTLFNELYETVTDVKQDMDGYFSAHSNIPEAIDYAAGMRGLIPHLRELEQIKEDFSNGKINGARAACNLSIIMGMYETLRFLKMAAEIKEKEAEATQSS